MGVTVNELKNDLRKEKIMYERYVKLLKEGKTEELSEEFEKELNRIDASLQD